MLFQIMILGSANSSSCSSKNKDLSRALLARIGPNMLFLFLLGKMMLEMGLGIHIWESDSFDRFSAVLSCLSSTEHSGPSPQCLSKLIVIYKFFPKSPCIWLCACLFSAAVYFPVSVLFQLHCQNLILMKLWLWSLKLQLYSSWKL